MASMSEGTIQEQPKLALGTQAEAPAGRPQIDANDVLAQMCASIRMDGISEAEAALLAGMGNEELRAWKRGNPQSAMRLAQASAEFHGERLAEIRSATIGDGEVDWRALAWLLQHTDEKVEAAVEDEPADLSDMRFDGVITLAHLKELQRQRAAALREYQQQGRLTA
jgi:hypothetical protein